MFCIKCGKNNDDNAAFCTECGSPLIKASENTEPVEPVKDEIQQTLDEAQAVISEMGNDIPKLEIDEEIPTAAEAPVSEQTHGSTSYETESSTQYDAQGTYNMPEEKKKLSKQSKQTIMIVAAVAVIVLIIIILFMTGVLGSSGYKTYQSLVEDYLDAVENNNYKKIISMRNEKMEQSMKDVYDLNSYEGEDYILYTDSLYYYKTATDVAMPDYEVGTVQSFKDFATLYPNFIESPVVLGSNVGLTVEDALIVEIVGERTTEQSMYYDSWYYMVLYKTGGNWYILIVY